MRRALARNARSAAGAGRGRPRLVRSRAREAREQAAEWADRGRDAVNQQKEQFRSAYEAGRQAYREATTETGAPKLVGRLESARSPPRGRQKSCDYGLAEVWLMGNLTPVFIALTGMAVTLQAGVLLAMYLAMRKSSERMETLATELKVKAIPTMELVQTGADGSPS